MLSLTVVVEGDGKFPQMADRMVRQIADDAITVTGLPGGLTSGLPSVAFIFGLDDGSYVFAETSLRLFLTAADALKAHYGDPRG